jgi:outer membrane protein insertion porin family
LKKHFQNIILLVTIILLANQTSFSQSKEKFELISVKFNGNSALPTDLLETVVQTKESPGWFSQFLEGFTGLFGEEAIYFDSLLIPGDVKALKALYESSGYFENKIRADYFLNEDKEIELTFNIREGDPAIFRKLEVTGLDSLQADFRKDVFERIAVDTSEIYSNSEVERNVTVVLGYLKDRGYVFARAESPVIWVDTLNNRADVEINFDTEKKYTVNEVRVQKTGDGKADVDNELIKEIVGIDSGDTYSYINMRRGQIRLYRTNLFTSALVSAITSDTVNQQVPIGITTDIGKIHEFSPEIIMNDEDNAFNFGFGLSFTQKNFLGDARKLSLNLSTAAQNVTEFITNPSINDTTFYGYADARIIVEQPFLFGLPIDTKLETYYTLQKRKAEYNAILYGWKLGFDFELPPYTYFNYFTTYFNVEKSRYKFHQKYLDDKKRSFLASNPEIDSSYVNLPSVSENINAVLGIGLGANKTNDFLFPTRGYNLSLVVEDGNALAYLAIKMAGIKFNDPLYYRAIMNFSYYLSITKNENTVFASKLKAGYIQAYRGNQYDIPLNQRFYVGGSNSVRGWNTRQLVPKNSRFVLPENPSSEDIEAILARGIIPGGFFMLEGSFEARVRLLGRIGSAVFIDYGNSWNSYSEVVWDNIAVAVGFGFRYYSEIVPIRVDFGFKYYDPSDRRSIFKKQFWGEIFQFHLGIGEAF